jgi:hypothetical protein
MQAYSRLRSHQSKKFVAHKKTKKYFIWLLFAVNIFLLFFCLSKITYVDFLTIKNISVYGTRDNISINIQNKVLELLDRSYLGIFSKSNTLLYPKSVLLASIQSIAPQVQSLKIERDGLQGLRISVTEKVPKAIVCAGLPDMSAEDNIIDQVSDCYVADWSGLIFDQASTSTDPSLNLYFIPSLGDMSTTSLQLIFTKYATSTEEFILLQNFYDSTKKAGLSPRFILIKDKGEYEMYADDTVVYFNDQRPIVEELQNLITFWKNASSTKYESIDIRYGSNIFYRQKPQ